MGALYGGYLSRKHEVIIVDVFEALVDKINRDGILIAEPDGTSDVFYPKAATKTEGMEPVDLIIVFVKAMFSRSALSNNRSLIGENTYIMTLQNGSGHEQTLMEFCDREHVVIGTTQHNSAVTGLAEIRHGGSGMTHIGCIEGDVNRLRPIAEALNLCDIKADCCTNVMELIWNKMFTNVSASVLTGVLQVPLGFIAKNENSWALCERLVREAVAVAAGEGLSFDAEEKVREVRTVCENSPNGITSICADLANGRKTEVDTISGSVVTASRRNGVSAPTHEAMVNLVHAMERKCAPE